MKLCTSVWLQITLVAGLSGSAGQELDPKVLLDKYDSCNKNLQTIYYELETTLEQESAKPGKCVYEIKYCSRNEEKQWIGHWTQHNQDGTIDQGTSVHLIDVYDDRMGVHFNFFGPDLKSNRPPSASLTRDSRDKWLQDYIEHPPYGGSLAGHFMGNNGRSVPDLLKGASKLKFENKVTRIIGHDAYLIEADTPYGIVRAWISPQLGHNCLKWEIVKRPGQFYRDGQFISEWSCTTTFDAQKAEQVDGQYVVTQARVNYRAEDGNKVLANETYHFSLKDIDLSPEYETLGAFKIQLPEGTVVRDVDNPPARYQWAGGQLVLLPAQTRVSDRPEVVLPQKPERSGVNQDLSPVSKGNLTKHVQTLAGLESRHITEPGNKKAEEYILRELQKHGYAPKVDAFQVRNLILHNVASDSSDKGKPVILLCAHFDSSAGVKDSQPSQSPGADDNASGVAALLELSRLVKEHPIHKNIEFVFFNCEESGLSGSRHLSDEYRDNHRPIDYVINVDMIGTWKGPLSNTCPVNFVTDTNSVPIIRQFAEQFPYPLRQAKTFWRDDHASFWNNGFKAIEITEDGSTEHMHKPTDTPEKLDYDNIARIVHGLYVVLSEGE